MREETVNNVFQLQKVCKVHGKMGKNKVKTKQYVTITHCTDIDLCCMGHWKSTSGNMFLIFFFNSLFTKHDPGEMKGKPPWLHQYI